ncbi:LysE family translocator [Klebsiella aerogenes]|uniref:LysE family translocator n=1 Tax=Klebsiella aerogenes TaxID=548 RepID=UPI001C8B43DF|nr:LysE family translocator [Klebsiella aerogenes]MBX8998097.1 LysE family translocator [Klebsiella aerogenes]HBU8521974.1 LysE family translocator [Klebsiella aerogenes]HBV9943802.1 LysE family translocator [Klebsiella aerogenes]HDS5322374.1 LysE family translocator [Klebsiella aerogenes]HEP1063074.1 LysE family translocator [Klebsiella aerogenes]
MPELASLIAFAAVALGLVLTPGPNMIYLTSRSICQGKRAGLISLAGVALGFIFYMLCAAFGISALVFAVPYAYDALRVCGVAYLLYLAWQAIKPGARSIFAVRNLPADSGRKLFLMGFITNLANPKIAIMYLSLLPQFITPGHGSVLSQSLVLGFIQALISVAVNGIIVVMAGQVALFLGRRPGWQQFQRWLMASVLAGMAVKIAFEARK